VLYRRRPNNNNPQCLNVSMSCVCVKKARLSVLYTSHTSLLVTYSSFVLVRTNCVLFLSLARSCRQQTQCNVSRSVCDSGRTSFSGRGRLDGPAVGAISRRRHCVVGMPCATKTTTMTWLPALLCRTVGIVLRGRLVGGWDGPPLWTECYGEVAWVRRRADLGGCGWSVSMVGRLPRRLFLNT
jgi:hypothetical protein